LELDAGLSQPDLPGYSRVLMDVLTRDNRMATRGDEAWEA